MTHPSQDKASREKRRQTTKAANEWQLRDDDACGLESVREISSQGADQQTVIPVIREELEVGKRAVETGKGVRVTKTVSEREEIVDEPLVREEVSVERVSINEMVADQDMPTVRYEGATMVVPILEEVVVSEKRTILKEEVRITRHRREIRDPQRVVLRTEQVAVEHFDDSAKSSDETSKLK